MNYGREILRDVEGYVPGEQPESARVVKLNTNENPYPPSPRVMQALADITADQLRRYPDPVFRRFRDICARRYGYDSADWIMIGNGMDELLALALRTFVDPGDTVVATYPTYSLYEVLCQLHGCHLRYIDLDDQYQLTPEFFEAQGRLCFLTRPNAPTGVCVPREDVARFCNRFPGIVVIDEAYVDFADDDCMDFPKRFENVIVMRTFSKSFSLAGMRIGTAICPPGLLREFLKTKDSYNMDAVSQAAGIAAMEDYAYMLGTAAKVRKTRDALRESLLDLGFAVPESGSNFLLAHWHGTPDARTIFERLRDQGIFVRYFNARRLDHCLRITVGTDEDCTTLINALVELIG
ncbi:MAG: histidinol-phosphate transaminase [Candidatus Hydrogenedentes bacterium]|nr:histidinol-phosphate transaminase [Candidatus Hydrogenedentota bacterium]